MGTGVAVPMDAIVSLRRRLAALPVRHPQRKVLLEATASLYAVSRSTLYRLLRGERRAKDAHRSDRGQPRVMSAAEIERWCEIVAALKVRTTNKKGRCLSNARILELLVEHGVQTPQGLEKLAPGRLVASTLNRHLRRLGYDRSRMTREPPALRFLFNAMAAKDEAGNPFQGIPGTIQLDNGPVGKSAVFRRVMDCLGVEVIAHMPRGSDGRRTTARSKGKVERPFRTVKEAHETLYHFHQPQTEAQANVWLANFVAKCNQRDHRSEDHSRQDDWLTHLPADGLRAMCAWERFCSFAREPERRTVGIDCRLTVAGVTYELDAELAGEDVIVWWGLFDQELFAERGDDRFGPFQPLGGPIPLHRYRKHRKSRREHRADQVAQLAEQISLPRAAVSGEADLVLCSAPGEAPPPVRPFTGPDHFHEVAFPTALAARKAIAEELRLPLAKLGDEDRAFITELLAQTLSRPVITAAIRARFPAGRKTGAA